jgi:hypothetical protein
MRRLACRACPFSIYSLLFDRFPTRSASAPFEHSSATHILQVMWPSFPFQVNTRPRENLMLMFVGTNNSRRIYALCLK